MKSSLLIIYTNIVFPIEDSEEDELMLIKLGMKHKSHTLMVCTIVQFLLHNSNDRHIYTDSLNSTVKTGMKRILKHVFSTQSKMRVVNALPNFLQEIFPRSSVPEKRNPNQSYKNSLCKQRGRQPYISSDISTSMILPALLARLVVRSQMTHTML